MEKFLLLVGLSVLAAGGAMYLAHASRHEPRWVIGSLLVPFIIPLYYRRHWEDLQLAGLLQAAGLAMALSGLFIAMFEPDQQRSYTLRDGVTFSSRASGYAGFVDSERSLTLLSRQGPGVTVAGRLHGRAFQPDRVELIDGVLRLSEGFSFYPDREVAVLLGEIAPGKSRIKKIVGPYDRDVPEVHLSWRDADGSPVTRIVRRGYRLDLELVPAVRGKLQGYVQLTLPDFDESYVAGDLEVLTTHLRYRDGEVDRNYDHLDTVYFVAEEFLQQQYKAGDAESVNFEGGMLDPVAGRAEAVASVALPDGRIGRHVIKAARTEFGWSVLGSETAAATEAAGYKSVYTLVTPVELRPQPVARKVPAPAAPRERTLPFDELATLTGLGATVESLSGRREQGALRGIANGKLLLEVFKGGGGVIQFKYARSEIASIRLNNGEVILVEGIARSQASAAAVADGAAATVRLGDRDLTPYVNKLVKVTTTAGKTTVGVFRGVSKDRLVVETQVGGGTVNYTVSATQLAAIDFASR
jgi:hypothetical protein